jgi:hypothetical protein
LYCPDAIENEEGTIAIEDKVGFPPVDVGAVTVIEVFPETVPIEAVIVTVPVPIAVNSPEALTVAIVLSELCHVACEVTF